MPRNTAHPFNDSAVAVARIDTITDCIYNFWSVLTFKLNDIRRRSLHRRRSLGTKRSPSGNPRRIRHLDPKSKRPAEAGRFHRCN
jgi:hypothetical protein